VLVLPAAKGKFRGSEIRDHGAYPWEGQGLDVTSSPHESHRMMQDAEMRFSAYEDHVRNRKVRSALQTCIRIQGYKTSCKIAS
jgi:hypothetical protein